MSLFHIRISDLEERHLAALVDLGVRELGRIEYKQELPGGKDEERKEFLADVSSFANAGGGDLVYGVAEEKGAPTELVGITLDNPDAGISTLENVIRDGLDPRLVGFKSSLVSLSGGRHALVIRVPGSFNRPHAVSYKKRFRYFGRTSNGTYPMDAGEVPADFAGTAIVVLHIMPLSSFDVPEPVVDLDKAYESPLGFLPIGIGGDKSYNFDGLVMHGLFRNDEPIRGRHPESYALLFRSGIVEAASSRLLWPERREKRLPGPAFSQQIMDATVRYLSLVLHLGIEGPVYVGLSLLGVRGYEMLPGAPYRPSSARSVDRDALVVPEVMIEELTTSSDLAEAHVGRLLRPVFDRVWNACGYPEATIYDTAGTLDTSS